MAPTVDDVRRYWEANPLTAFENPFPPGSPDFYDWHEASRRGDNEAFALPLYEFDRHAGERVLDLGCGVGWLTRNFAAGKADVTAVDLTARGVELTRQGVALAGLRCGAVQANAERLPFGDATFDFVACTGVLHHTPGTREGLAEIRRVLRPGGRAVISLYYRNWMLSRPMWPLTRLLVRAVLGHLPGRDAMRRADTPDDFVRIYDGDANPLGKSYGRREVLAMLEGFTVKRLEKHYFPRRFMPFGDRLPAAIHRALDRTCGLMIFAILRKDGAGR